MPGLALYLLKVIICSAVLFGYYQLFLRNKVYHAYNRFYLLGTVAISLLAPAINFNLLFSNQASSTKPIQLLQVVNAGDEYLQEVIIHSQRNYFTVNQGLLFIYLLISMLLLFILVKMLLNIARIIRLNDSRMLQDIAFVESDAKGTPFSFFKYIFWNNKIDVNTETGRQIFAHELAHVRERHSADKLFLNLVLVCCWINPVFWLIKKELNLIHEFIADKKAVSNHDASVLAAMIVTSAYPTHTFLLTNHFFYSPIKRRLQMLTKYNNKKAGYWYRLLALPVILFLVAAFTIKMKKNTEGFIHPAEKITVVIDAGHGGKDGGATGTDGTKEKDLTLLLAKKIKELNAASNIDIILTRETDIYQSPREKAEIAQNANADLLISIHGASAPAVHSTQAQANSQREKSGMEIYIAREEFANTNKSRLFASAVINQFRNNYKLGVNELPLQRKVGIAVIQSNPFPSILIETGYMNNPVDLAYMKTSEGQETIARNILNAVAHYADNRNMLNSMAPDILSDTIPAKRKGLGVYKGERIKNITVKNVKTVELLLANGEIVKMTLKEAEEQNIPVPPPPPPPPPPGAPAPPAPPVPPAPPEQDRYNVDASERVTIVNGARVQTNMPPQTGAVTLKGSLNSDAKPLVIVDGKEISYEFFGNIDPNSIESINVLKGETATAKYKQALAKNGVLEIKLKDGEHFNFKEPVITSKEKVGEDTRVFNKLEQTPEFPGGTEAWAKYLRLHLNPNIPVDDGWKEGTYKIIVRFIVSKDGTLSDFVAETYAGTKPAQACIDLIKKGPNWVPGKQKGMIVNAYRRQPITFVVQEN